MEKSVTLEEALKRIEELEKENAAFERCVDVVTSLILKIAVANGWQID